MLPSEFGNFRSSDFVILSTFVICHSSFLRHSTFVARHSAIMFEDSIAAIATPLGEGGLAVIRISGPAAFQIADACFVPAGKLSLKPSAASTHTIHFGHVVRLGQIVDEVLLSVMRAPRTF